MKKEIGLLLHISSLPNDYTIGTMGKECYKLIDILSENGINIWQILPINPTEKDHSPYSSVCSFAGNISFIDFEEFYLNDLITKEELNSLKNKENIFEDQDSLKKKQNLLKKIYKQMPLTNEFEEFITLNKFWLDDYALFLTLQEKLDEKYFYKWPSSIAKKDMNVFTHGPPD